MKFRISFFCLCVYFAHLSAEIIEFSHFKNLASYLTKDTLLVLDIDDTLLVPSQMLGCDEWFSHQYQQYLQQGMDTKTALQKALTEWLAVRHISNMELVESETDALIRNAQESGFQVMGLTTQSWVLAYRTTQHLLQHNIDLSLTAPSAKNHSMEEGIIYKNGVLFCSGNNKGKALFHFFDLIGYRPKHIVFVDDKASHLAAVELIAQEKGVAFMGLRYNYSDARKAAFCPEIAEYQFHNSSFNRLLSDEEAMNQLEQLTMQGP